MVGEDFVHFMTLTPAFASTSDREFARVASQFLVCMNERLYGRRYGPGRNGRWLQGWAFFERQNCRAACDDLIEGLTGVSRPQARSVSPLHVHIVMNGLQLGEMSFAEQQQSLREAALHACGKVRRDKAAGRLGTLRQQAEFLTAWNEDGGSTERTRRLATRATQVQLFHPKGVDIRPVTSQAPLVGYLTKQLTLGNCQYSTVDFLVPIAPNGFSLATY